VRRLGTIAVQNDLGFSGGMNLSARKAEMYEKQNRASSRSRRKSCSDPDFDPDFGARRALARIMRPAAPANSAASAASR
jgi:hypothetical protein